MWEYGKVKQPALYYLYNKILELELEFALIINKLEDALQSKMGSDKIVWNNLRLVLYSYADDGCIFSETVAGLQKGINILQQFCNDWNMYVNTDKTEVIVFSKT